MRGRSDQRGMSTSILMLEATFAILLVAGLVVDGGQKVAAARWAEATAANACRAGADAYATTSLAGSPDRSRAVGAAYAYLAAAGSHGTVTMDAETVVVRTSAARSTIFLSVIGVPEVRAEAEASARLVSGAQQRTSGPPPR